MKYIVFWLIASWGLTHVSSKDEFGFYQLKEIREKIVFDTLSKEFLTEDSALAFKKRAQRYKPDHSTLWIDSVWIDSVKVFNQEDKQ